MKRFIIGKTARSFNPAIVKRFITGKAARSFDRATVKRFIIAVLAFVPPATARTGPLKSQRPAKTGYLRRPLEVGMRMFYSRVRPAVSLLVAAAFPFVLLGCPDKANPDPATAAKDAGAAATTAAAPGAGASAAAPAKSGGGW